MIGEQKGRKIEIMNSIELLFDFVNGDVVIDMEYYNLKEEQCKCHLYKIKHGVSHFHNKINCYIATEISHPNICPILLSRPSINLLYKNNNTVRYFHVLNAFRFACEMKILNLY